MNNDFEMNGYDSDPADCNGYRSGAEFNTESSEEFTSTPSEFGTQNEPEDFFNSPGIIAPLGKSSQDNAISDKRTDIGSLYDTQDDTESASDNSCGCGCDDDDCAPNKGGCGCGYGNSSDSEASEEFDHSPDDETAATSDDFYNATDNAREKCSLDDYEIISDVLGSEKQLVKLYSTALCESAEEGLRNVIQDNLIECAQDQYSTFEYMEKRGLYQTEEAPEETIAQAKQQFRPLLCNDCGCDK